MKTKLASYSMKGTVELPAGETAPQPEPIPLPEPPAAHDGRAAPRASSASVYRQTSQASCRAYRFPVRLSATGEQIELHGELSTRVPLHQVSSIQVLLAGGSNAGQYWDWPLEPESHCYIRHATRHGFATLNLDRPGYGKSDRPDPMHADFAVQGDAVNQVIAQLRSGALGHRFDKVVLHGHSMGGMTAWHAAGSSTLADAVIVGGVGHNQSDESMAYVNANVVPVEDHPAYGLGLGWPRGYFARPLAATPPSERVDFYTCMLQDTVMAAELKAIQADSRNPDITRRIRIPVLFALGDQDIRWCTTTRDCRTDPVFLNEASYYEEGVDFTSFIVPDCGHLTNKDPGAPFYFEKVTSWLRERGL